MVSAIVSSLRGAFGRKTAQELTQAEIASILQQTIGQLDKVWVEIQVLVDDETKTEDMAKDVEGLRSQYRNLAYYCAEMSLRNDVVSVKSDLSVFKANQEVAEQLRGDTITLRRDTLNTSKKVLGISSRLEVNMINRRSTTSEGTSYQGSDDSLPSAGLPNLIRFGQHIYARLRKHEQKHSRHNSSSAATSQQSPRVSDLSGSASSPQLDSRASVAERPVMNRENTTYRLRLGYQTSTEEIILTGENQTEVENPAWLETALGGLPEGRLVESEVQAVLERATRQMSVDNMSLASVYFDADSSSIAEN